MSSSACAGRGFLHRAGHGDCRFGLLDHGLRLQNQGFFLLQVGNELGARNREQDFVLGNDLADFRIDLVHVTSDLGVQRRDGIRLNLGRLFDQAQQLLFRGMNGRHAKRGRLGV